MYLFVHDLPFIVLDKQLQKFTGVSILFNGHKL